MGRLAVLVPAVILAACSGATSVADLAVGDCFDDPNEPIISELELIDCDQPHDNEVFANLQVEESVYPGEEVFNSFAVDACLAPFEAYVGESYADSPLDYWYLTPTEESWAAGDRAITCVLYSADLSSLTGSARPAG
jgi:hypothetical protein